MRRELRRFEDLRVTTQLFLNPLSQHQPTPPQCSEPSHNERASSGAMRRAYGPPSTGSAEHSPASPAPSSTPPTHMNHNTTTKTSQTLRCNRHRRRPRRLRSFRRGRTLRRPHRARHTFGRKPRRMLLQSFLWRNRQGHHAARDRRPGWRCRPHCRQGGRSVPSLESQERTGGLGTESAD